MSTAFEVKSETLITGVKLSTLPESKVKESYEELTSFFIGYLFHDFHYGKAEGTLKKSFDSEITPFNILLLLTGKRRFVSITPYSNNTDMSEVDIEIINVVEKMTRELRDIIQKRFGLPEISFIHRHRDILIYRDISKNSSEGICGEGLMGIKVGDETIDFILSHSADGTLEPDECKICFSVEGSNFIQFRMKYKATLLDYLRKVLNDYRKIAKLIGLSVNLNVYF